MFFGWKVVATAFIVATFAWSFGFYGPSATLTARLRSRHRRYGIVVAQREFPPGDVDHIVALVTAVNLSVFAFALARFGLLREASGSYAAPFLVAAVAQLLAGAIVLFGREPLSFRARTGCPERPGR